MLDPFLAAACLGCALAAAVVALVSLTLAALSA
jgi:hypothetical protein